MLLSPVNRPANSGLEELHESPLTNQSLGTSEIQWKNPGMSTPMERDEFLIIDQARADNNTDLVMAFPEWIPYFQNYTSTYEDQMKRGFKQCLKNAGFEVEICNYFEDEFLFFSRESMINYFLQWLPQLSEIKGQTLEETGLLHRKFVTQVIDIYCDDKDLCKEIRNKK